MADSNLLAGALEYANRGWAVFPLVPGTKRPLTQNGFKGASSALEDVQAYWTANPHANVAIATGEASGLVIVDVDRKHGGLDTLRQLEEAYGPLGTYKVRTGSGGLHFYFRHPGVPIRNKAGLFPGVDIRGDGGYVVAPPSELFESGAYQYLGGVILDIPAWLLEHLVEKPRVAGTQPGEFGAKGDLAKSTLRFILEGAAGGRWHAELFKAAIDLKQQGYEYDEAVAKLESGGIVLDDSHDHPCVLDVFENREAKYPPRMGQQEDAITPIEGSITPFQGSEDPLFQAASSLIPSMVEYLSDTDRVLGEPTGIPGLDHLLGGGLRLGEMLALCAVAKTGKSTLFHKIIFNLIERGVPVGYASREMDPAEEVMTNLLSLKTQRHVLRSKLTPDAQRAYEQAASQWPLYFAGGYMEWSEDKLTKFVRELKARGVNYFFIDHLHLCMEDSEDFKAVARYAKHAKKVAQQEKVTLFFIVQPKNPGDGTRLSMHSMRGGASINQVFNAIFLLERQPGVKDVSQLSLDAARSKLCNWGSIYLQYDHKTMDFIEVEPELEKEQEPATPGNGYREPWNGKDRVLS